MSDVATDLFQIGSNDYIALVDRYSGWHMCAKLRSNLLLVSCMNGIPHIMGLARPTMYIEGFQLLDLIIPELKSHVIPYKFKCSHWWKIHL